MFTKNLSIKLIKIIHLFIILYIIICPCCFKSQNQRVVTILVFILYRWITHNDTCTLTTIENKLTGNNEGFIYRIVNPIYQLRESTFNRSLYFLTFSWLIIVLLIQLKDLNI